MAALRYGRGALPVETFPRQVEDLRTWLENSTTPEHPFHRVRAMPRGPGVPELWILGSGGHGALYAAELGCGYSFAQFISGEDGAAATRAYRERFRPSTRLAEPRASVGVGVICAGTGEEARRLAASLELWRRRIAYGQDRGIPSPEEALRELEPGWEPPPPGTDGARVIAGDPDRVRAELLRLAERCGVDEVMAVTVTHDPGARMRSYELLAEAMGLEPRE